MGEVSSEHMKIKKSRGERLLQRLWEFFRAVTCWPTPWFAIRWRRWMISLFAWGHFEPSSGIARTARVDYPWRVRMGRRSSIGEYSWIQAQDDIIIGNNVCVGEYVKIITGSHDITSRCFNLKTKPIVINDGVWIVTGAIVQAGVTIGEGAVVATGAVVTKDVEPWTVVGGNPARLIKNRVLV